MVVLMGIGRSGKSHRSRGAGRQRKVGIRFRVGLLHELHQHERCSVSPAGSEQQRSQQADNPYLHIFRHHSLYR